jgi:hypothetical protein
MAGRGSFRILVRVGASYNFTKSYNKNKQQFLQHKFKSPIFKIGENINMIHLIQNIYFIIHIN